jgi:ribose transport system permease protein
VRPIYFDGNPEFYEAFMGKIVFGIPNVVFIMFGAAIVASLILTRTVFGRYTFALGSNEEATRLSGVNVVGWKIAVYGMCGLFAGLAGTLIAARMTSAQPSVGLGYELDAIAAAVIGGTSLSGGEGSIVGTVIGAFIISTLTIGLSIVGVPDQWKLVITGGVVIGAVWLDILRRRSRAA